LNTNDEDETLTFGSGDSGVLSSEIEKPRTKNTTANSKIQINITKDHGFSCAGGVEDI